MKIKFKKLPLILGAMTVTGIIPLSAVSCMYDDDPTIVYARKFIKDNGFEVKKRIAPKEKPNLVEFENNLFNSKLLIYTFVSFKISPQSIVEVNNNNYKVTINDLYTSNFSKNEINLNDKQIKKIPDAATQTKISEAINKLKAQIANYIQNVADSTYNPNIPNQYRNLKGLIEAAAMPRDVFNSIKFLEYDDDGKVINDSETGKPREDSEAKKIVAALVGPLRELKDYTYLDQEHYKENIVTEADAKAVVENFLKDTPFYATYLESLKNPDTAIFKWDSASYKGTFNFQNVVKYYNSIPTSDLQKIQMKFFGSLDNLQFQDVNKEPIKYFKEIYQIMKTAFVNYSVKVDAKPTSGISLGFAPEYLIYGVNTDTGESSIKYTVFDPVLNDERKAISTQTKLTQQEQSSFLSDPYLYFWTHAYQLYLSSMNDINIQIFDLEHQIADIKAKKTEGDLASLQEQLNTAKEMLAPYNQLLIKIKQTSEKAIELINKIKIASDQEGKEAEIAKLKEELNSELEKIKGNSDIKDGTITGGILDNELVKNDILEVFKILSNEIAKSTTTISSLASLYSELMFGNGLYKIQLVKGGYKAIDDKIAVLKPQVEQKQKEVENAKSDEEKAKLQTELEKLQAELSPYEDFAKSFYWIEFQTSENKKYFFDVYKNYLSYQSELSKEFLPEYTKDLSKYNIDNAFSESLPEGYIINPDYNNVSYFGK
ncbi:hypothetical protein [Mycoplasma seminis]|uniref:Lipoprotein n=1 Tax=Mycoplasma seminis TaxID=512749 RepID=A0ABY9HBB3_9MOLU|nr:hypothetical protein [Mycoplasma seminis]WLP85827.1 hypothetical protein Q8852_01625 [Mycoplasma seminis]